MSNIDKILEFIILCIHKILIYITTLGRTLKGCFRKIYVVYILSARNRWYLSKRGNLYNPIFKATVYKSYTVGWNIARFDRHWGEFSSEKQAQETMFKIWMQERINRRKIYQACINFIRPIFTCEWFVNMKSKILELFGKSELGKDDSCLDLDDELCIVFMPSLYYILNATEQNKGSPLVEEEVLDVVDKAVCMTIAKSRLRQLEESKGYVDIDPENAWQEWCEYKKSTT